MLSCKHNVLLTVFYKVLQFPLLFLSFCLWVRKFRCSVSRGFIGMEEYKGAGSDMSFHMNHHVVRSCLSVSITLCYNLLVLAKHK